MNKNIFYYFIAALLIISGCSKSNISSFSDNLDRHAPIFHAVFANKESKTYIENRDNRLELYWTADDRISIFNGDNVNQVYVFIGETGSNSAEFLKDRSAISVRGEDEYKFTTNYSVYPHSQQTSISNDALISVNLPEVQYYAEKSFGPGANTMVAVTSNLEDYFLAFKNLCGYLVVKLYGTGSVRSVKLCGKNGEKISGKALVTARYGEVPMMSMDENASETIVVDCGESGVALSPSAENPSEFWFCVPPTEFNNGFTISITGTNGTTVEKSVSSSRTITRNIVNSLSAIEVDFASAPASPEIVDLGLSVKWASCNVGATKPEEYGDYYAWGEIETYYIGNSQNPSGWKTGKESGYYWPSYKWSNYSGNTINKYCTDPQYGTVDNKTVLDPEDDVAHVLFGDKWRIPVSAEFEELIDNCTSEWTTLNGVNGVEFTSKINGMSIFLPAAGFNFYTDNHGSGTDGQYWSSSLEENNIYAHDFSLFSNTVYVSGSSRIGGRSIRSVYGDRIPVSGITLNESSLEINVGDEVQLNAMVLPENASIKTVVWSRDNSSVISINNKGKVIGLSSGTAHVTVTTVDGGYQASCCVIVTSPQPVASEMVDLGLSVKWASCNVGATKPEEYGGYYAWGETSEKSDCSFATYKYGKSGCYIDDVWYNDGYTKYVTYPEWGFDGFTDGKTVLDPEDDVAHVTWGSTWRIPTKAEFEELVGNCTSEWTSLNGVEGIKFTSNKNGNSIFLPASGSKSDTLLGSVGSVGYYWSSSLHTDLNFSAWALYFYSDFVRASIGSIRDCGRSVRPVSE